MQIDKLLVGGVYQVSVDSTDHFASISYFATVLYIQGMATDCYPATVQYRKDGFMIQDLPQADRCRGNSLTWV